LCATCTCHRKHAIRVLKRFKRFTKPKPKKRGPKPAYWKDEIVTPLKRIRLAAHLPCSKRLKVILPIWMPGLCAALRRTPSVFQSSLAENLRPNHRQNSFAYPIPLHYTKRGSLSQNRPAHFRSYFRHQKIAMPHKKDSHI